MSHLIISRSRIFSYFCLFFVQLFPIGKFFYIPPTPFSLLCIPGGVFKSEILTVHINKLDEMVGLLTVYWGRGVEVGRGY
jgi:hypothetical protein